MEDRFASPKPIDEGGIGAGKLLQWAASTLFLASLGAILAENFSPQWLDPLGVDHTMIIPFSIFGIVASIIINATGLAMSPKGLSGIEASSNLRIGGKEVLSFQTASKKWEEPNPEPEDEEDEEEYDDGQTDADILKSNKEWATSEIVADQGLTAIILWVIAIIWNAISIPAIFPITKKVMEGEYGLAFIYLFPMFGLLFLGLAVRITLQHRKFGRSIFAISNKMGRIGGTLEGTIRSTVSLQPTGAYTVKLSCTERLTSGSGKNRRTETKILWESEQTLSPHNHNALSGIPVSFDVPSQYPESYDVNRSGVVTWKLAIHAPMPGVDYEAEFEVPVGRKRNSKR